MSRYIFPSFKYTDSWYVNQIRTLPNVLGNNILKWWDGAEFEKIRIKNDYYIADWIGRQMEGCSCLVLFCGVETYKSKWVKYEWELAYDRNMGRIIINMAGMNGRYGEICADGMENLQKAIGLSPVKEVNSHTIMMYKWKEYDAPHTLMGDWIEDACKRIGR